MTVILNAAKMGTRKEAHDYLKEMFGFPEYYGCNLDALADCLGELPKMRVVICNTEGAGDYFQKVLHVFEDYTDLYFV